MVVTIFTWSDRSQSLSVNVDLMADLQLGIYMSHLNKEIKCPASTVLLPSLLNGASEPTSSCEWLFCRQDATSVLHVYCVASY